MNIEDGWSMFDRMLIRLDPRPSRWTAEAREEQAERCRRTRPWERSTGPRSVEGKLQAAENGRKNRRKLDSVRDRRASARGGGGAVEQLADLRRMFMF